MSEPLTEKEIRRRMPYPIATAWHRVRLAQTDEERANRLTACDDVVKRTLAAFMLPDYLRGEPSPAVENEIQKLRRPTSGEWTALVRELSRYLGQRKDPPPFMPEICSWYFQRKGESTAARQWESLVQSRNAMFHGSELMVPERAKRVVNQYYKALRDTLLSMTWLQGYRPFRVLSLEPNRQLRFEGNIQFFVGSEEWTESFPGEWDVYLLTRQRVYLTNPAGTELLDLVPFLEVLTDDASSIEHLYLFKAAPGMKFLERSHDDTASLVTKAVRDDNDEETSFERWLSERPQKGTHQVLRATGGGIFRFAPDVIAVRAADGDLGPRFEKLETLGRGGMATVYKVRDVDLEQDFALKVLNSDLSQDPVYRERFRREAKAMSAIRHPCIVPVIDVGLLSGSQPFLKMPIMKNGSLQDQIGTAQHPEMNRVLRWADNALDALDCIHKAGVVHRDVKPSNFLLSEDDRALLTDFGVALNMDDQRLTRTLEQMGTLAYMAPEQRSERTVTGKADIFSLAVVLHELVAGSIPTGIPGEAIEGPLGALIRAMGATKPDDRPSAAAALRQLREIVAAPVPAAREPEEKQDELKPASPQPVRSRRGPRTPRPTPVARSAEDPNVWRKKVFAGAILAVVFALNFVETSLETWLRSEHGIGVTWEQELGAAARWFEMGIDFDGHDAIGWTAVYASSIAYFFVFPLVFFVAVAACARFKDAKPLLFLSIAMAIDYAMALPFYIGFPVPERWTFADSGAILASDLWTSKLIQAIRPFSGLNNCFPSFHVSATIIAVGILFAHRFAFRRTVALLGAAIILSTFLIGIHWTSDIIAGVAAGVVSLFLAWKWCDGVSALAWLNRPPRTA